MTTNKQKRVLHLGRYGSTLDNIEYLKRNNVYLIIGDKCHPQDNPYKDKVDEVIELDIDNQEEVIGYCKNNSIDAVVTNWSEDSYEPCRIYNEAIGNAYFHTEKQWNTFMHKDNFRKLCVEHGIDTPKTFFSGKASLLNEETINSFAYPIIIKPTDNGGAKGISVILKKSQLKKAINFALSNSKSGDIIIEEFIEGNEVSFTYVIQNNIIKLTACSDKYCFESNGLKVIPELYLYPCKDIDLYLDNINEKVISMIRSQNLNNATIFFQGIEKNNKFFLFEAGLRCEGTAPYIISRHFTGQDFNEFFYNFIIGSEAKYNVELDDPKLNGHRGAMYVIHLKKGKIGKIEGLSCLKKCKLFIMAYVLRNVKYKVGNDPLDSVFGVFYFDADNKEKLFKEIKDIQETIKVKDLFGRNLIENTLDIDTVLKQR